MNITYKKFCPKCNKNVNLNIVSVESRQKVIAKCAICGEQIVIDETDVLPQWRKVIINNVGEHV